MMRRPVILCRRQRARVVGEIDVLHHRRDKLVGGKTPERSILQRHDDMETPRRRGDELLLGETVQRELGSIGGNVEGRLNLTRGKVVAPAWL